MTFRTRSMGTNHNVAINVNSLSSQTKEHRRRQKKKTSPLDLKQPTPGLPSKLWLPLPPMPQSPDSRVYLTAIPAIFQANTVIPIFQLQKQVPIRKRYHAVKQLWLLDRARRTAEHGIRLIKKRRESRRSLSGGIHIPRYKNALTLYRPKRHDRTATRAQSNA